MTNAHIEQATAQAQNIIAMMDAETLDWFKSLGEESQFQFMCAALAATA